MCKVSTKSDPDKAEFFLPSVRFGVDPKCKNENEFIEKLERSCLEKVKIFRKLYIV
jgi:hypothetical protein